jgi:hypothetical protein
MEVHAIKTNMTPDLAEDYLKTNTNNRTIRDYKIMAYARTMQAGDWVPHISRIVIDEDGALVDGQHTLLAIIESNTTIGVILQTGVDPHARDIIDTGISRSLDDSIRMQNFTHHTERATASRLLTAYARNPKGFLIHSRFELKVDRDYELKMHDKWDPLLVQRLDHPAVRDADILPMSLGSWVGVAVILDAGGDPDWTSEFLSKMGTGVGLSKGDPALKSRNAIVPINTNDRNRRSTIFNLVWRGWNEVIKGGKRIPKTYDKTRKADLPLMIDGSGPIVLP